MEAIAKQIAKLSSEEDIAATRKMLTEQLKKIKAEPVANAGAGKEEIAEVKKPAAKAAGKKPAEKAAKKAVVAEVEVAAKPAPKIADGKRITRIAGKLAEILFKGVNANSDKEKTAVKKDFNEYVEGLTTDDYDAKNNEAHAVDFLDLKKGAATEPAPIEATTLSLKELEEMKNMLTEHPTNAGMYWHEGKGEHFTGPAKSSEEGLDEAKMDDEEYFVGETTKRVYDKDDNFLGFMGFGKFEKLVVA